MILVLDEADVWKLLGVVKVLRQNCVIGCAHATDGFRERLRAHDQDVEVAWMSRLPSALQYYSSSTTKRAAGGSTVHGAHEGHRELHFLVRLRACN